MKKILKVMEWNMHGNAGKGGKIPYQNVDNAIKTYSPHIIVFTEFDFFKFNKNHRWQNRPTINWPNDVNDSWSDDEKKFYNILAKKGYKLFITDLEGLVVEGWKYGWNGIGIAVKTELRPRYYSRCERDYRRKGNWKENEIKEIKELKKIPDHLVVACTCEDKEIAIVGARVRTAPSNMVSEYKTILNLVENKGYVIIAGDFNNGAKTNFLDGIIDENSNWFLYTPQCMKKNTEIICDPQNVYSHQHPRYKTYTKIDHIITNFDAGISTVESNDIVYDWDCDSDCKKRLDHAVLYAEIRLPNKHKA